MSIKDIFFERRKMPQQDSQHPLYATWNAMIYRCYSVLAMGWPYYGGRGVTVCSRWRHGHGSKTGFQCWVSDMGEKPSSKHSIDRIDPEGNYEPNNCRWATCDVQANNKRGKKIKDCPAARSIRFTLIRTWTWQNHSNKDLKKHLNALLAYGTPRDCIEDINNINAIEARFRR